MSSNTYALIARAIQEKLQVTCQYHGYQREICPHTLGYTDGKERMLAFQFAGGSSKGLEAGGEWRCMNLAEVSNVATRRGDWHTDDRHLKPQTCVKTVELQIAF